MVAKWKFYIIRGCFLRHLVAYHLRGSSTRTPVAPTTSTPVVSKFFLVRVDFDPSEIRNMWKQLPTQWVGTSGPLDHKLNQKSVPTGHKVKIFPFGCLVLTLPDAYQLGSKTKSFRTGLNFAPSKFGIFEGENFSQENPKKQDFSMPTTWEVLLTCTLTTE